MSIGRGRQSAGRPPKPGWLRRLTRRLWLGSNPLRRRTDRIEAWVVAGLAAAFLIGAPLSSVEAGSWVNQASVREQLAQQSWHLRPAVVLRTGPAQPHFYFRTQWNVDIAVLARWSDPDGRTRTGEVLAPSGTSPGQTVAVWIDRSGRPTGPPLAHAELVRRVILAALIAPVALAVLLFGLGWLARWLLDRRRLAAWEAGWARIGPRWTRHR